MSLLMMENEPKFQRLAREIYDRQFQLDFYEGITLTNCDKENLYQGVQFCVTYLYTAYILEEPKIFEEYARWIYQLLCPLKLEKTREQIYKMLTDHFKSIHDAMGFMKPEEKTRLDGLLHSAADALTKEYLAEGSVKQKEQSVYEQEVEQYLEFLKRSDTKGAVSLIQECINRGISLSSVYVDIITEAMRRVGELWHQHVITVDMEHYCTSVTQLAISQMFPIVFGHDRSVPKRMLAACAGSELHELGARMVADLFEYNGWDSVYLGAAVPSDALLSAIEEQKPDLVALSVTMPQHLPKCREMAEEIRRRYPEVKIAVGGNAFKSTNEIWRNWSVDVYTCDARELVAWAEHTL